MAWTYVYQIERMKVKDEVNNDGVTLQNAVCQTFWKVTGTNSDGDSAEFSGATPLSAASVSLDNFTDFSTLTEDTVIGWIRNIVEGPNGYIDHINSVMQKQIDVENESEIESSALPWADPEDDVTPIPEEITAEE